MNDEDKVRSWPKGTHTMQSLGAMPMNHAWHRWHLAEHGRTYNGYLQLLWVCPCGAYSRKVLNVPYLNGTKVPDLAWDGIEAEEVKP